MRAERPVSKVQTLGPQTIDLSKWCEVEVRFTLTAAGRELDASGDGTRRFCIGDGSVLSLAARHLLLGMVSG